MQVCLFPAWVLQLDTGGLAEHSVQKRAVQTSSFCGPSSAHQAKTGKDLRPGSWPRAAQALWRAAFFNVVDDGDPEGFQSSESKKAKKNEKIRSWALPPHSPGMKPLDTACGKRLKVALSARKATTKEPMASYRKRLIVTAKRLPRKLLKDASAK